MKDEITRIRSLLSLNSQNQVINELTRIFGKKELFKKPPAYVPLNLKIFVNIAKKELSQSLETINENTLSMQTEAQLSLYMSQTIKNLESLIESYSPQYEKVKPKDPKYSSHFDNYLKAYMIELIPFKKQLENKYEKYLKIDLNNDLQRGKETNNDLNKKSEINSGIKSIKNSELNGKKSVKKFRTKLSVAQLALLFDLLREEGIIEGSSKSELEHFIADNFSSKKQENISQRSLHNKLNEISDKDRKVVSDLVIKLYNNASKK